MSSALDLPMDASELIPQRDPMKFVDRLLSYGNGTAEVEAVVAPDNPLLDDEGHLDRVALLEFLAQACAAMRGYEDRSAGGTVKVGLLVGTRRLNVWGIVRRGDRLIIRTETVGAFEGFTIVDGRIMRGGDTVATGTLKLWVTDDSSLPGNQA